MNITVRAVLRSFETPALRLPAFDMEVNKDGIEDPVDVLERIFRLLNHVHPGDAARMPTGGKHRSLSCGDLVLITSFGSSAWWFCDSFGWRTISTKDADKLIADAGNPFAKPDPTNDEGE
jgi:hypothetical protein